MTNLDFLGDSGEVQTDDGSTFEADLVLKCTGNTKVDLSYAQGLGTCFSYTKFKLGTRGTKVQAYVQLLEKKTIAL